jgi:hypothetical protein
MAKMELHNRVLKECDIGFVQRMFYILIPFMFKVPSNNESIENKKLIKRGTNYIVGWVVSICVFYVSMFLFIRFD